MRVVQSVAGTFHHFDVAHQLEARHWLERLYSTYPWRRLEREGIPRQLVETFPWFDTLRMASARIGASALFTTPMIYRSLLAFDRWVANRIPDCDVLFALSCGGLATAGVVQGRGGSYVCDRGSAHIRVQDQLLREEYARWGVSKQAIYPPVTGREEAEYELADAITVPSTFARQSFLDCGVPAEKVRKLMYGVRLDRFFPDRKQEPEQPFDVLFAGQISFQKGTLYLLEAFQKLRIPGKRLRLAGPVEPAIRRLLDRYMPDGAEMLGPVSQDALRRLMSKSQCLVLPSVQDGFGLVMAQAMACGCPVIASEHTGGPDLITEGVNGFVVPIRSPEAILERFQQLADDPRKAETMREASLQRVKSLGGWDRYGSQLAALFQELRA